MKYMDHVIQIKKSSPVTYQYDPHVIFAVLYLSCQQQNTYFTSDTSCEVHESRHAYEWVTAHISMSHVTHINESRHLRYIVWGTWVISHIWSTWIMSYIWCMNHVKRMKKRMSHIWKSHVTRTFADPRATWRCNSAAATGTYLQKSLHYTLYPTGLNFGNIYKVNWALQQRSCN